MTDPRLWGERAACRRSDPAVFFPDPPERERSPAATRAAHAAAVAVCERCECTAECLEYALANDERFGVWGATTPSQRRMMLVTARRYRAIDAEIIATIGRMRSAVRR